MCINHRGAEILVSQQLLHRANVRPTLQQMGGKRMPESVTTGWLSHVRLPKAIFTGSADFFPRHDAGE
jgi:hypothetical protein